MAPPSNKAPGKKNPKDAPKFNKSSKQPFKPRKDHNNNNTNTNTAAIALQLEEDDVPDFPRGGGSSLNRKERDEIRAEVDAEFEAEERELKKGKKKRTPKEKITKDEDDLGSLFGDGVTGKLPRYANKITMKNISPGMKVWGVVSEVNEKDLVINLPGALRRLVRVSDAFDPILDDENEALVDNVLPSLFRLGQLVSCIVLQLDEDKKDKGKRKIWLSKSSPIEIKRGTLYRRQYRCSSSQQSKSEEVAEKNGSALVAQPLETKLDPSIAKFVSLICNIAMMKQYMMEIGYNADKLPLGKLSKSTILKGYNILKSIADVIGQSNRTTLKQLSGEFYTVIPHDFGFKKMSNFVIDTPQKLKQKLEMVEALGEIEVASKLINDGTGPQEDPLYSNYQSLHCELTPLGKNSEEFDMVSKYLHNTRAKTHSSYTVDIVQIFRASKDGEVERYRKFFNMKNRMLLWHGSRITNWAGILSQGLRIAPPEAPVTGYMFGKGVYFADMFSKSANYCYASNSSTAGVLLLCEVALGDMAELLTAKYDADKLPEGKLSTKGVGGTEPDSAEAQLLEDGVMVPLGKPKENRCRKGIPPQQGRGCGLWVMLYMNDIVKDKNLGFATKWEVRKGRKQQVYTATEIDTVRNEWANYVSSIQFVK